MRSFRFNVTLQYNCGRSALQVGSLRLFRDLEFQPPAPAPFQVSGVMSKDPNFPGHWVDIGGELIIDGTDGNPVTTKELEALLPATDQSLGLIGYYVLNDSDNDGKGTSAGNFYIIGRV
jgi:hypothetical protein